jgi:hypothetical protein
MALEEGEKFPKSPFYRFFLILFGKTIWIGAILQP